MGEAAIFSPRNGGSDAVRKASRHASLMHQLQRLGSVFADQQGKAKYA